MNKRIESTLSVHRTDASVPAPTVVIFAKAPVAGYAKTRLIPALGKEGAAALAARLLQLTVREACKLEAATIELCVAPDTQHAVWDQLQLPAGLQWTDQSGGNLGERLIQAARCLPVGGGPVLFIGTDCPGLDAVVLTEAALSLATADACMVPAVDGGYVLFGFNRFHPHVFSGVPWSTSEVAAVTRKHCNDLSWTLAELPALQDIDQPEDLQWLTPELCFV